jgi:hypothetical protein
LSTGSSKSATTFRRTFDANSKTPSAMALSIEPITLANVRANAERSVDVSRWLCRNRAILSADPWPDHVPH